MARLAFAEHEFSCGHVTVDRRNPMTEQITGEAFVLNRILQEHRIAASIDVHDIINPGRGVLIYGLTPKPGLRTVEDVIEAGSKK